VCFVLPRHGHKGGESGCKVSGLEENTLEIRPVKTIELMKTPKYNRCAQIRTHAKGYLLDGKEKGGNAKRKYQKKSVLSNVEMMQKFQKSNER
jgi:hypothetical protein